MKKEFWKSKTFWGCLGFAVFGIANIFYPTDVFTSLILASLAWTGYGLRHALG